MFLVGSLKFISINTFSQGPISKLPRSGNEKECAHQVVGFALGFNWPFLWVLVVVLRVLLIVVLLIVVYSSWFYSGFYCHY